MTATNSNNKALALQISYVWNNKALALQISYVWKQVYGKVSNREERAAWKKLSEEEKENKLARVYRQVDEVMNKLDFTSFPFLENVSTLEEKRQALPKVLQFLRVKSLEELNRKYGKDLHLAYYQRVAEIELARERAVLQKLLRHPQGAILRDIRSGTYLLSDSFAVTACISKLIKQNKVKKEKGKYFLVDIVEEPCEEAQIHDAIPEEHQEGQNIEASVDLKTQVESLAVLALKRKTP
jgi:hypothetical protein